MISILCPTRKRPNNMETLCSSIKKTSFYDELEIIFYIDNDDVLSQDKVRYLFDIYGDTIKYVIGDRILFSQMWNVCYDRCVGDIIMYCADDVVFRTTNWDCQILEIFKQYNDKITLVYGRDGIQDSVLATHGFIHRSWVEVCGYLFPPYFSSDWSDSWLHHIARNINRLHYTPDLYFEHAHCSNGKSILDDTYRERMDRGSVDKVDVLFSNTIQERLQSSKMLQSYIDKVKNV